MAYSDAKPDGPMKVLKGVWTTINSDARTAQSATDKINPTGIAGGGTYSAVNVPVGAMRFLLRARFPVGTASIGTSPVVRVFGFYPTNVPWITPLVKSDGSVASNGAVNAVRLDGATTNDTDTTIALAVTNVVKDSVYFYSEVIPNLKAAGTQTVPIDTQGASAIGVVVTTAAAITASAAVEIQIMFMN